MPAPLNRKRLFGTLKFRAHRAETVHAPHFVVKP
jgi:hypothetical protein